MSNPSNAGGPGPSLEDIGAARRQLHERQAGFLSHLMPGTGGGHDSSPDAQPDLGYKPVAHKLQEAEDEAAGIKTKMAKESGVEVAPQQPLPTEQKDSNASGDPVSNIRAHSPVELPSTPPELPDTDNRANTVGPIPHPPLSAPRVPSGVLLCSRGMTGGHAAPSMGPDPLLLTTSVPGSMPHVPAAAGSSSVDNALEMALAGSAGMEGPAEHGGASSPRSLPPHASTSPSSTHPRATTGGGASGTGLLGRVMAPFVAYASDRGSDAAEPQYADPNQPNPYDSNQAMSMGPGSDSRQDNRAYVGGVPMALGALTDRMAATLHDVVEAGARALGDTGAPPEDVRPEDLPGMPGSMEIDQEIRAMRTETAHAHQAAREEAAEASERAAEAAREGDVSGLQEAAEAHTSAVSERTAAPGEGGTGGGGGATAELGSENGGHGGGLMGKLVDKVAHALHLGAGAPRHPAHMEAPGAGDLRTGGEDQPLQPPAYAAEVGAQSAQERREDTPVPLKSGDGADVSRAVTHPGTSDVERPPTGSDEEKAEARRQLGIPAGAQHAAEARDDLTTKEGGQMAPAGATGQTRANPDAHVAPHSPESSNPNFFQEVENRGLGSVLSHAAANIKDSVTEAKDRAGGEPAPWATTSGAVSDTRDITRNVERVDHMDDPTQHKIYDAETYKVGAVHPKVTHDIQSDAEKENEDSSAVVLGGRKAISGAVPHEKPQTPIGASGTGTGEGPKTAAAKSPFDAIGTAKGCAPDEGRASVREASEPFLGHEDELEVQAPGGTSSVWSFATSMAAAMASRILPVAKAVGGASAGTPTGTDRTQKPPVADWGDNTAGRPEAAYGPPSDRVQDVPTPGGITNAPVAHFNRAHNKNEPPVSETSTPERELFENIKGNLAGSPEAAGVPRRGAFEPGQRGDLLMPPLEAKAQRMHDGLPDKLGRIGESVGGALQHVVDATSDAMHSLPNSLQGRIELRESEQKQFAKEAPGGEEAAPVDPYSHPGGVVPAGGVDEPLSGTARQVDLHSGGIMSAHHKQRLEGLLENPDPARKRETFVDKVLYPFSKDAGRPDEAIAQARSYYEYIDEKKKQQEEMDKVAEEERSNKPLGEKVSEAASDVADKVKDKVEDVKSTVSSMVPGSDATGSGKAHGVSTAKSPPADKPSPTGHKDAQGRLQLSESDKPFAERDFNKDAPGATGPRIDEKTGREFTQSGSGLRHVTGDVVTEVPAYIGQAVIDTGRSVADKLRGETQEDRQRRGEPDTSATEQAKATGHAAAQQGTSLLDRAALAVGNVIGALTGSAGTAERKEQAPPPAGSGAPANTTTTATTDDEGYGNTGASTRTSERAYDSSTSTHPPAATEGGEPHKEGGLAERVMGTLGNLLGGGEQQLRSVEERGSSMVDSARDKLSAAMEPAGEHDLAGYGRGATGAHDMEHVKGDVHHTIPEMPYTSTQELMHQRGQEQQ